MPECHDAYPAAIGCRHSFAVSSRVQASLRRRSSDGSKFVVQIGHESDREREQPKSIAYARNEASFTKVNSWT